MKTEHPQTLSGYRRAMECCHFAAAARIAIDKALEFMSQGNQAESLAWQERCDEAVRMLKVWKGRRKQECKVAS